MSGLEPSLGSNTTTAVTTFNNGIDRVAVRNLILIRVGILHQSLQVKILHLLKMLGRNNEEASDLMLGNRARIEIS
jgi:hypothetical protein